ncbi:MAG: sodium-independent anion transporter [Verrucomicrobia bacterium RIFCSPHIGHO2_12_FULL_41_10]|nr:MAG: sodium-independent anion transporter [Verrucomicrobia bacterium RIFCSPHIGHO2_12_FULL_41_10]HLB33326.1 SulP family inorganic anion transporter [Chthoniobacterales bacterium]
MPSPHHRPFFRPQILEIFKNGYRREDLTADCVAGITVGLITLPLSLALGIASIPHGTVTPYSAPAIGVFTAIIAGFLVSLFGGSRLQISGPTAAFIPIILLIVEQHGYLGLMIATIMAGIMLVIMGILRLGTLIKYIPWPVTSGFTTGIAVLIIATQLSDFLGIHSKTTPPGTFLEILPWIILHLRKTNFATFLIALFSLALIFYWPRIAQQFGKRLKQIPGSIIAMTIATVVVAILGLHESAKIATVGSQFGAEALSSKLSFFHFPSIHLSLIRNLLAPAGTIALLGAIQSLLSAVVADGLTSSRHNSNTELIAQGIANIVSPFFGGLPSTGAVARTSANINSGARTPLAGIITALVLLLMVMFFAHYVIYIPMAVMAAILIAGSLRMGEWHELQRIFQMPPGDAVVFLTTFALTVVFDLVLAVGVGMVLAAILFIHRIAQTTEISRVTEEDMLESPAQAAHGKKIPEGVIVYRIFGPFLFGAAEKMEDAFESLGELPKVLILRLHLVTAMDATALNVLESVVERIKYAGGCVVISGIHRQPLDLLRKAHFIEVIGRENFCATFDDALERSNEIIRTTR